MDIRKIKKLIELVEESGISELEISEGEESVRISRAAPAASFPVMQQAYDVTTDFRCCWRFHGRNGRR
ncbi:hypothetical protein ACUN9W_14670, partial [Escherichia coli]